MLSESIGITLALAEDGYSPRDDEIILLSMLPCPGNGTHLAAWSVVPHTLKVWIFSVTVRAQGES